MLILNVILVFTYILSFYLISVSQGNNICLSRVKNPKRKARLRYRKVLGRSIAFGIFVFLINLFSVLFSLSIENKVFRNYVRLCVKRLCLFT